MFHCTGQRFTSISGVQEKIRCLEKNWNVRTAPAIIQFAEESGVPFTASNEWNGLFLIHIVAV